MNAVASPCTNEIIPGFSSLRMIFSLARSSADPDESMPENDYGGLNILYFKISRML
jgi:hypothetical protein